MSELDLFVDGSEFYFHEVSDMCEVSFVDIEFECPWNVGFKGEGERESILPFENLSVRELMQNHVVSIDGVLELQEPSTIIGRSILFPINDKKKFIAEKCLFNVEMNFTFHIFTCHRERLVQGYCN